MTEQQFLEKVDALSVEVSEIITDRARKILKTGAINLRDFNNDYRLPKMFICAAAREIEFQFKPLSSVKEGKAYINKLELFI